MRRIVRALDRAYPDVGLALDWSAPLELLIALILAAQCTDERVNRVTERLFTKYRNARAWARVERSALESEIRSTGYYRNKARAIQECCGALVERFGGRVPETLEELVSLPGVGRKTANILRGNAFRQPAIGVDTHVARLARRLALTGQEAPDKIEHELNAVVPDELKIRFCHLLQAHGRALCTARRPECALCPLERTCPHAQRALRGVPLGRPRGLR